MQVFNATQYLSKVELGQELRKSTFLLQVVEHFTARAKIYYEMEIFFLNKNEQSRLILHSRTRSAA
jgi:hypothetical protein